MGNVSNPIAATYKQMHLLDAGPKLNGTSALQAGVDMIVISPETNDTRS